MGHGVVIVHVCVTFHDKFSVTQQRRPQSQDETTAISYSESLEPSFAGLTATYADHLRLIGKPVANFLFVLIELFTLDVTAEALRAKIDCKSAFLKNVVSFG